MRYSEGMSSTQRQGRSKNVDKEVANLEPTDIHQSMESGSTLFRDRPSNDESNEGAGIDASSPLVEEYLTRSQAMELLHVEKTAFARLIRDHDIPSCRLTRRPLYRKSDLVKLIERHMVPGSRLQGTTIR